MSNQFDEEDAKAEREVVRVNKQGKVLKKGLFHAYRKAPSCDVCSLPEEKQKEVKEAYVNGASFNAMKYESGCCTLHIRKHADANDWSWDRAKKTERALAIMQQKGLKYIRQNPDAVDGELLLKVTQHIDRREGKIVERIQNDTNVAIQFMNMPTAISPAKNAREQLSETKKPLTLSPSSVEVLDEGITPAEVVQVSPDGLDLPTDKTG